ncbi:MAG: hypothetical protein F6K36_15655 [Symploca sp. SIO3C6]|nr:hypothetical protein [Symploca sp. SIO3C6]NET04584.1 hypothetical protein [Symploca sp. SIO2B6]NET53318.1 hypothetical protein [Merismopedia sp. SIO2A8]
MRKSKATEARRVIKDIAAIRAALNQHGYRLRKHRRQLLWSILITPERSYQLTYQPAPISAWVIEPQTQETNHQTLTTIIKLAITGNQS